MARLLPLPRPRFLVRLRFLLIPCHAGLFFDYDHRYECNPAWPEQHVTTRMAPESDYTWNVGHLPDVYYWLVNLWDSAWVPY
jgi:hypothetical protein